MCQSLRYLFLWNTHTSHPYVRTGSIFDLNKWIAIFGGKTPRWFNSQKKYTWEFKSLPHLYDSIYEWCVRNGWSIIFFFSKWWRLDTDTLSASLYWRHNDHDGVSNHQPHGCLLNRLFGRRSTKTPKLCVTGLCAGNSPGPVNSPHKGPVTRKLFPFDDVIMFPAPWEDVFWKCDVMPIMQGWFLVCAQLITGGVTF